MQSMDPGTKRLKNTKRQNELAATHNAAKLTQGNKSFLIKKLVFRGRGVDYKKNGYRCQSDNIHRRLQYENRLLQTATRYSFAC
jgi:hypothetical protein